MLIINVLIIKSDMIRIIVRIDIKNSYLVKGVNLEGLRVLGPLDIFTELYANENVDEIYITDTVASLFNRDHLINYIKKITKKIKIPITISGGIRKISDIENLLNAGADKVCINSEAIKNKKFLIESISKFGSSTITAGIDASQNQKGTFECFIDNGRERSGINLIDWINIVQDIGVGEIILTSIDKDGTRSGFDEKMINSIDGLIHVPLIIGGGASKLEDFTYVLDKYKCVDGFSIASIIHYNFLKNKKIKLTKLPFGMNSDLYDIDKIDSFSLKEIKNYLIEKKYPIRKG